MNTSHHQRAIHAHAFTAIEMVAVLAIMATLTAMAVPALMPALRKGRVNEGASVIAQMATHARSLARRVNTGTDSYGIVIVNEGKGTWVGVTKGTSASSANLADTTSGKRWLSPSVTVTLPSGATEFGWMYENRTGFLRAGGSPTPGTAFDWAQVTVRSLDATSEGRYRRAIAVYRIGFCHVQEL